MKTNFLVSKKANESYKELILYLESIKNRLSIVSSIDQFEILEEMYETLKEYALILFEQDKCPYFYSKIIDLVYECEKIVTGFQINSNSNKYIINEFIKVHSVDTLLDYITTNIRNIIIKEYQEYLKSTFNMENLSVNINQIDLTNLCDIMSEYVKEECLKFGIKCEIIKINPAFNAKTNLYKGKGYHYFNILEFQGHRYIMDLSYSQFFKQNSSNMLSRLGIPYLEPCKPGIYMMMDDKRSKVASIIISRGWIKLTENNFKEYLDGFTLSYRNGLYYELLGKVDYTTNYSYNDYIRFLEGTDNILRYEPKEGLGYQIKPLKNPYLNFKINK